MGGVKTRAIILYHFKLDGFRVVILETVLMFGPDANPQRSVESAPPAGALASQQWVRLLVSYC